MENELKQAQDAWKVKKDFNRDAVGTVWNMHRGWRKIHPDATPYLSEIQEFILERENIPAELHDQLHHEIYLANAQERRYIDDNEKSELLSQGYKPLTKDVEYRGKIELKAKYQGSFATNNISQVCKLITSTDGTLFVVAHGKRSRGWYVRSLDNAFYKPLTK